MKLAARIAAALALVAFAAPALPCGDQAHPKSASVEKKAAVAKADAKGKKADAKAQVKN